MVSSPLCARVDATAPSRLSGSHVGRDDSLGVRLDRCRHASAPSGCSVRLCLSQCTITHRATPTNHKALRRPAGRGNACFPRPANRFDSHRSPRLRAKLSQRSLCSAWERGTCFSERIRDIFESCHDHSRTSQESPHEHKPLVLRGFLLLGETGAVTHLCRQLQRTLLFLVPLRSDHSSTAAASIVERADVRRQFRLPVYLSRQVVVVANPARPCFDNVALFTGKHVT
jgi:hypothetical protein